MRDEFSDALISDTKSMLISEDNDLFGPMIGNWDFEWVDGHGTRCERHVQGEWFFVRVLEGLAVQDVFICPSRQARQTNKQPDAAYGSTMRIYDPASCAWSVSYFESDLSFRLDAKREGDEIVLTEITTRRMKWIFSEITCDSFRWRHFFSRDDGTWRLIGELFAIRKK